MALFQPCLGKQACRDNGEYCLTCGRKLVEIERLRQLIAQLTVLAIDYDYENAEIFTAYIARKLNKTIRYRRGEDG